MSYFTVVRYKDKYDQEQFYQNYVDANSIEDARRIAYKTVEEMNSIHVMNIEAVASDVKEC